MIAVAFALAAAVSSPPACATKTRAAIAFHEVSDASAIDAVEKALARACFTLTEVAGADDAALVEAARALPVPWLLVAKATLAEAPVESYLPYTKMPAYSLGVDVTAFDAATGERRGRALRSAHVVSSVEKAATSREASRVIADAVRVLEAQLRAPPGERTEPHVVVVDRAEVTEPAPCTSMRDVVVLWHKGNDTASRAAVLRGLEKRCVIAKEQIEGNRTEAMEWARDLGLPLLAVRTTLAKEGNATKLTLTVDLVDAQAEGLKILMHASDARSALGAVDEADAWRKAEAALVAPVLDKALPR